MNKVTSAPISHAQEFFIGGKWVKPSSNSLINVVNPTTEETYVQVAEAQVADIENAVTAARHAFDNGPWPKLSYAERAECLNTIGTLLQSRAEDIATAWSCEMGIVHSLAKLYCSGLGSIFQNYAKLSTEFDFISHHATSYPSYKGLLVREPVGVVGAIIPWNGPMSLIAFKLAPALLAGCTAIVKASPEAPCHALIMAEVVEQAGLPPGVVNVLTADRVASEALVTNPGVDKISFTGSSATGKSIASQLGSRMARYTLELGGKSAAIVLDDYDLQVVADTVCAQTCNMTGQVCAMLSRIIVSKKRHDDLLDALGERMKSVQVGDPFDSSTQMGPLVTGKHRDRVEKYIEMGRNDGFTLAAGGGRPAELQRGFYVEPTLFGDVKNSSTIAREEIFGPVVCVIPASSEIEAIDIANDSPYGLCGAVFTNDNEKAYTVARQIRTGTVSQNGMLADFDIAFGGFKESGIGREGGAEGLLPYLESKTVLLSE